MANDRWTFPRLLLVFLLASTAASCIGHKDEEPELAARTIRVVSGNYQQGGAGAPLPEPVVFEVRDSGGVPLPGARVTFRVVSGGGQVGSGEAVCDAQGRAEVSWTAGEGLDPLLQASSLDENQRACAAYAYANTSLRLETAWISGVTFYKNFTEPVAHDGRIFESNSVLTFSDSSSEEMKVLFSKSAEEDLLGIMAALAVADAAELGISGSDPGTKMKIYARRAPPYSTGIWVGVQNSAIMFDAIDCQRLSPDLAANHAYVRRGLKHEITHMVQLLIIGPPNITSSWPPCWFTEGLAEHVSGGVSSCPAPITTVAQLDAWLSDPRHSVHPLEIQEFEDIPSGLGCEYYAMFNLVLDFLLAPNGGGRTGADVKALLQELARNHDFPLAFSRHMGMSVDHLHDNLRDLLADWLQRRSGPDS